MCIRAETDNMRSVRLMVTVEETSKEIGSMSPINNLGASQRTT